MLSQDTGLFCHVSTACQRGDGKQVQSDPFSHNASHHFLIVLAMSSNLTKGLTFDHGGRFVQVDTWRLETESVHVAVSLQL